MVFVWVSTPCEILSCRTRPSYLISLTPRPYFPTPVSENVHIGICLKSTKQLVAHNEIGRIQGQQHKNFFLLLLLLASQNIFRSLAQFTNRLSLITRHHSKISHLRLFTGLGMASQVRELRCSGWFLAVQRISVPLQVGGSVCVNRRATHSETRLESDLYKI